MHHTAYVGTSRHGIFYFRWPIPAAFHPQGRRSDVKVSLRTRCPKVARELSRLLISAGLSLTSRASRASMNYSDIRHHVQEHYRALLRSFKAEVSASGPVEGQKLDAMTGSMSLVEADPDGFVQAAHPDGGEGLLRQFCARVGIREKLSPEDQKRLRNELMRGYQTFLTKALEYNSSFDLIDLEEVITQAPQLAQPELHSAYDDVVREYFKEHAQTGVWAAKTRGEKQDALALLGEITGGKPLGALTKADAREVKRTLLHLPKNRRKNAATRDLSLPEMLTLKGQELISSRTLNSYVSHLQTFTRWAVANGHADINVFEGMRVKVASADAEGGRRAFSNDQLALIFEHLTSNPRGLVKKADHKWPTLIAMFSGMRLNEVAQLQPGDIKMLGDVWCIDVNTIGDSNKRLKNASSHRVVPIHQKLLDLGLLGFSAQCKSEGALRMFPSLTHSKQNGYGRNVGRWFNESLLVKLGLGGQKLMFHCLRHSMVTQLGRKDIPEPIVKAILGHVQVGVTYNSYFKAGFLPSQLIAAINSFSVLGD